MGIKYFLITLIASILGAIAGFGGGVMIRPAIDAFGTYDISTIIMLSSITVLVMSTVSSINYIKYGIKYDLKIVFLILGALIGGLLGKYIYDLFASLVSNSSARAIQASILLALLFFILFRKYYPHFKVDNKIITLISGLIMGLISAFLGIGGGPINVVIMCMIFSIDVKESAAYSIYIILFSQLSSVGFISITTGLKRYDLSMLLFMIPAAVIGGIIGTYLNRRLVSKHVDQIFNIIIYTMIILNIYILVQAVLT